MIQVMNNDEEIRLSRLIADRNRAKGDRGIECPKCGCRHFTRVRNSEPHVDSIKRYRVCRNCGHIITTYEKAGGN